MTWPQRRSRTLSYTNLHTAFREIHSHACTALVYPLQLTLKEWLEPQLQKAAAHTCEKTEEQRNVLFDYDPSFSFAPCWTQFRREFVLLVKRPSTMYFINDDPNPGRMSEPRFFVTVGHPTTYGDRYVNEALGQWFPVGNAISLGKSDSQLGESLFSIELKETLDFTIESLNHLFIRLTDWFGQFSMEHPNSGFNTISGTEHYHRIAAACYYAPVINQWAQFLDETRSISLAPVCKRLSRTNRFTYERAMEPELSSVLQQALTLAQAQNQEGADSA